VVTTVLLSGFEPFDGASSNSSWDAVRALEREWSGPATLATVLLPVEFARSWSLLEAAIAEHSPDIVIAVGLADGRTAITPERVAINLMDARIPDNAGNQPRTAAIAGDGPTAYFSGLPVDAIADGIRAASIPSEVSLSAGAYVCNDVMYRLLHAVASARPGLVAGFIHVPAETAMPIETIARGLAIAVDVTVGAARPQFLANQGG
jgi:pyroglutamyl-peptidase